MSHYLERPVNPFQSARTAAAAVKGRIVVHVIDGRTASSGLGILVLEAGTPGSGSPANAIVGVLFAPDAAVNGSLRRPLATLDVMTAARARVPVDVHGLSLIAGTRHHGIDGANLKTRTDVSSADPGRPRLRPAASPPPRRSGGPLGPRGVVQALGPKRTVGRHAIDDPYNAWQARMGYRIIRSQPAGTGFETLSAHRVVEITKVVPVQSPFSASNRQPRQRTLFEPSWDSQPVSRSMSLAFA